MGYPIGYKSLSTALESAAIINRVDPTLGPFNKLCHKIERAFEENKA